MDPLSISASVLTVLSAVIAGVKTAKSICDAPDHFSSLTDEYQSFSKAARELDAVNTLPHPNPHLRETVENAKNKLNELHELILHRLTRASDGVRVDRLAWARHRSQVRRLRDELEVCRRNLSLAVNLSNSSLSSRIEAGVSQLSTSQASIYQQQQSIHALISTLSTDVNEMRRQQQQLSAILLRFGRHSLQGPSLFPGMGREDLDGLPSFSNSQEWNTTDTEYFSTSDSINAGLQFPRLNSIYSQNFRMENDESYNPWMLNLSMHFRNSDKREKFFVTYLDKNGRSRRITVSCNYEGARDGSLEAELSSIALQRDRSCYIFESIKESLADIEFYNTVTNLCLQTKDDRVYVHVTEDISEVIDYPLLESISCIDCEIFSESSATFKANLSGFVYKVRIGTKIYMRKDIPGCTIVEAFLYELYAFYACKALPGIAKLRGIISDDNKTVVKGLLLDYPERGMLADIIYDMKEDGLPWKIRERWAFQIIEGLSGIHENGFVVGDFSLFNIAITKTFDALIIDIKNEECLNRWTPPELGRLLASNRRLSRYMSPKSDLYQLGMVLWALAEMDDEPETQTRPFVWPSTEVPPYFRKMAEICLSDQPQNRIPARELLLMIPRAVSLAASFPVPDTGSQQDSSASSTDQMSL